MAETLTFENTQEVTSAVNLNADEQDSLQVGEAMQEAQDNLLAGKYKDAQELEKAYVELQQKLGEKGSKNNEQADESQVSEPEKIPESKDETEKAPEKDGILETVWEEAAKGEYTKETVDAIYQQNNETYRSTMNQMIKHKNNLFTL